MKKVLLKLNEEQILKRCLVFLGSPPEALNLPQFESFDVMINDVQRLGKNITQ